MSDVEQQIAEVRQRIEEATRRRARQEAERDAAQASLDRVLEELRSEFGVDTREGAVALVGRMESELRTAVDEVRALIGGVE